MALCTAAEYKAWRGITKTDWDTVLGVMITTATAEIERLCGRTAGGFESATFTEVFDGDGSQVLQVSNGPISSITSITIGNSDPSTLASTGYTHDSRFGIMRLPFETGGLVARDVWGEPVYGSSDRAVFTEGFQNITVVYVAGYATIPDDLKRVCYQFISHYFDSRGRDFEKAAQAIGNSNMTVKATAEFVAKKMDVLSSWRPIL